MCQLLFFLRFSFHAILCFQKLAKKAAKEAKKKRSSSSSDSQQEAAAKAGATRQSVQLARADEEPPSSGLTPPSSGSTPPSD